MFTKDVLLTTLKTFKRADMSDTEFTEVEEIKMQIISALILLPYIEKNIIYSFYMQDDKWEHIAKQVGIRGTQCKIIRTKALDTLLYVLNRKMS